MIANEPTGSGRPRLVPGEASSGEVRMKALRVTGAWLAVAVASIVPPFAQAQAGQGTVACRDEIGSAAAGEPFWV